MVVNTYIVVKYKIHLYWLRNRPEKLAILLVSKARTNKFYIYRQCTYIVYVHVSCTLPPFSKSNPVWFMIYFLLNKHKTTHTFSSVLRPLLLCIWIKMYVCVRIIVWSTCRMLNDNITVMSTRCPEIESKVDKGKILFIHLISYTK